MNRWEKHNANLLTWLRIVLLILFGFTVWLSLAQFKAQEDEFKEGITPLLLESIREDISSKMQHEDTFYRKIPDNLDKPGKYVLMTIHTGDSIIEFYRKKEDSLTEARHSFQSFLTHFYDIGPDSVNALFQDKFNRKGISVKTITSVTYGNIYKISDDTTAFKINYRTPPINQGLMDEIRYQGFVSYSSGTIIKLMPKGFILAFLFLEGMFSMFYFYIALQKKEVRPDRILKQKEGYYHIGLVRYDSLRMELHKHGKSVKLTQQQQKILNMLLEHPDNCIDKKILQEALWAGSITAYNSMTTAVNRLRATLQDIGSDFNLSTKKGTNTYLLEFRPLNNN